MLSSKYVRAAECLLKIFGLNTDFSLKIFGLIWIFTVSNIYILQFLFFDFMLTIPVLICSGSAVQLRPSGLYLKHWNTFSSVFNNEKELKKKITVGLRPLWTWQKQVVLSRCSPFGPVLGKRFDCSNKSNTTT